jgi:hypothetical protein
MPTWTAPDLADDDRDALRQIVEIDWADVGYAARLAASIEEARRYNAALVKPERHKAVKHDDQPTLFPKGSP